MDFGQLLEPSFNSLSGLYISSLANRPSLNPGKNASLLARVKALALRHLAAFPLVLTAILDLIACPLFLIGHRSAKHYLVNLVATLSLFPQAIGLLFFGKQPAVNYLRAFDSETRSLRRAIINNQNPRHQELILKQLKRCDETFLTRALNQVEGDGNTCLSTILQRGLNCPKMADFLIEKTNLDRTSHCRSAYLRQMIVAFGPLSRCREFNKSEHKRLLKKLITTGAPLTTRAIEDHPDRYKRRLDRLFGSLTDLDVAVKSGWLAATKLLLKYDDQLHPPLSPEQLAQRNNKLLALAAYYKKPALIKFLLKIGADPLARVKEKTVWNLALETCHAKTIKLLIAKEINPNTPTEDGFTAMDFSLFAFSDDPWLHPAEKTYCINDIATPLENEANQKERFETAKMLLQAGADFKEAYIDAKFTQAIEYMESAQFEALEKMQQENEEAGESANPYLAKILWLATSPYAKEIPRFHQRGPRNPRVTLYAKNLRHLLNKVPELVAEKEKIIADRTEAIHQTVENLPSASNFPKDLANLVSKFCYS